MCIYFLSWEYFKTRIYNSDEYLNTGELMGVESMLMMLWSCFISFLLSLIIYGFAEIIEYYEMKKTKDTDILTNENNDVK